MNTPDPNAFAAFIPGFEFLQNLTRQAAGGASGQGTAVPGMPPMSHWVAPTFDVEELDKRIQDLKAVHFWLEQNTKALAATIQALEVQRMTLATLQGMNVSMQEMAEAFKAKPDASSSDEKPEVQPRAKAESSEEANEPKTSSQAGQGAQADPMQWWGALTEQFQTIAAGAMRDMNDQATQMLAAAQAADAAVAKTQPKTAATKKAAKKAPAKSSTPAPKTAVKTSTQGPTKKAAQAAKKASLKR
jgi:hypothetical protein